MDLEQDPNTEIAKLLINSLATYLLLHGKAYVEKVGKKPVVLIYTEEAPPMKNMDGSVLIYFIFSEAATDNGILAGSLPASLRSK